MSSPPPVAIIEGWRGCWAIANIESVCESKCALESFWSCISVSWGSSSGSDSIGASGSEGISSAASAASRRAGSSTRDSSPLGGCEEAMMKSERSGVALSDCVSMMYSNCNAFHEIRSIGE